MKFRRKYLSYPQVQLAIVGAFLVAMILFFSIVLLFLSATFSQLIALGREVGLPSHHVYFQFINMQTDHILSNLILVFLIVGTFGTIFFIWFSHSLIGPIVTLIEYLKRSIILLKDGQEVPPIQFRKSDYFQDLGVLINALFKITMDRSPQLKSNLIPKISDDG